MEEDRTAGKMQVGRDLWVGSLIVRDGVVLQASPSQLAAFSADTGKLLCASPRSTSAICGTNGKKCL